MTSNCYKFFKLESDIIAFAPCTMIQSVPAILGSAGNNKILLELKEGNFRRRFGLLDHVFNSFVQWGIHAKFMNARTCRRQATYANETEFRIRSN